jgi:hypothetical protein
MEQLGSHWTDFREIGNRVFFEKFFPGNPSFIKIWQK